MHRLVVPTLALLLLAAPAQAADRKFDPAAAAKAVAPFLDGQTVSVIHADLTRFDADAHFKQLAALTGLKPDELARPKKIVGDLAKTLTGAGVKDVFVVVSHADLPKNPPFVVLPLEKGADAKAVLALKDTLREFEPKYESEQIGQAVVVAAAPTRKRLKDLKPEPRPELAKAFAAGGDGLVRVVSVLTPDVRKQIEQESPTLPKELGGGSIKVLTDGMRWSVYTLETSPKVRVRWVAQAADKDAAKALHDWALGAKKALLEQKKTRERFPEMEKWLDVLTPQLDGDRLTLTVEEATLASFLTTAVVKVREAAVRSQKMNNLHQLGLAMHNRLTDQPGLNFPPVANFDKQNKPLLSWRVHLLPYLGEEEQKLYKEFKLDEPWDSDHNKKLIAKMPKVFASPFNPKLAADGKTTYLAPVHKGAAFTGDKTGVPISKFGSTSRTILLVDVEDDAAVVWTKPDDLKLDPKDPHKGLGFRGADGCMVLFADGSVQSIPKNVDKMALWAWFLRDGKKPDLP